MCWTHLTNFVWILTWRFFKKNVYHFLCQSCWPRYVIAVLPTADLCPSGCGDRLLGHYCSVSFQLSMIIKDNPNLIVSFHHGSRYSMTFKQGCTLHSSPWHVWTASYPPLMSRCTKFSTPLSAHSHERPVTPRYASKCHCSVKLAC